VQLWLTRTKSFHGVVLNAAQIHAAVVSRCRWWSVETWQNVYGTTVMCCCLPLSLRVREVWCSAVHNLAHFDFRNKTSEHHQRVRTEAPALQTCDPSVRLASS